MGRRERGVAILEFALVAPVLLLVFAAVVDFGIGWRKTLDASSAIRGAVRVEASLGDRRETEVQALTTLRASLAELHSAEILRVIVYKSSTADGKVPPLCKNVTPNPTSGAGRNGECNVYSPSQIAALTASRFSGNTASCQSDDWDRFWCPTSREADQGDGADYVGIWVEYRIDWIVGVLPGGGLNAEDSAVMRIEPSL